jgi:FkbM family methyltransferase
MSVSIPRWSQSQFGEVEHIFNHALSNFIHSKVVVDVGAADSELSNSIDLIRYFGFYGLLIEANPVLAADMSFQTKGLNCKVLSLAIGTKSGRANLFLGINKHISSLDEAETASWGPIRGKIEVEVKTLHAVLKAESIPKKFGLLTIDIEGLDLSVLDSLIQESKYRPQIIIFEFGKDSEKSWEAPKKMQTLLKEYIVIAVSGPNVILRHKGSMVKRLVRRIRYP